MGFHFLRLGVSNSYISELDFLRLGLHCLRLGVSNSHVSELDFLRLGGYEFLRMEIRILTFWGLVILTFGG